MKKINYLQLEFPYYAEIKNSTSIISDLGNISRRKHPLPSKKTTKIKKMKYEK
jgi:hypothetical protein|nr:MAG: hypothetical protein [Microviridae sp.]